MGLTNAQRRVHGTCPVCGATQGKRCDLPDLRAAHIGRLQRAATYESIPHVSESFLESRRNLDHEINERVAQRESRKDIGKWEHQK